MNILHLTTFSDSTLINLCKDSSSFSCIAEGIKNSQDVRDSLESAWRDFVASADLAEGTKAIDAWKAFVSWSESSDCREKLAAILATQADDHITRMDVDSDPYFNRKIDLPYTFFGCFVGNEESLGPIRLYDHGIVSGRTLNVLPTAVALHQLSIIQ